MLSFQYRFHGHGSLRYVYKNGRAERSHLLTLKYTPNHRRKRSRFAVVVSKKVHKGAVGRNRIRRRLYEIIRHEMAALKAPYDIVLIVSSSEILTMPAPDLESVVTQQFTQANLYKPSK
jgi:ribonuclease P protein component